MNMEMKGWTDRGRFTGFAIRYKYPLGFFSQQTAELPDFFQ